MGESATGKLDPLTTVRFFGAVYIVTCHWWRSGPQIVLHNGFVVRSLLFGGAGVSGFYLLSGFILAWVYLSDGRPIDKRQFYRSRFARIYPIFFVTLVADTPWYFISHIASYGMKDALLKTGAAFTSCLFMLQAWGSPLWGMDFPNWSLSVETFCYALFPVVGLLLWRLRGIWIWVGMLLLYIGGQALVALAVPFAISHQISPEVTFYLPPLHASTFFLGVLLAKLRAGSGQESQMKPWVIYAALAASPLIYFGAILITPDALVASPFGDAFIRDGSLAPVFCALVWALSHQTTRVSRLLSTRWLVILGDSSYGLYLIHVPVLHAVLPFLLRLFQDVTWHQFRVRYIICYVIYLLVCMALSVAGFYWIETPARKWITGKSRSQARGTAKLASAA